MADDADAVTDALHAGIETIESGYEFLLAYAAQGRATDDGSPSEVRETLIRMKEAAARIVELMEEADHEFAWVVRDDARKSGAAISLVLGQDGISSEMVDNLNASIHLRAMLTDLFLVSEAAG